MAGPLHDTHAGVLVADEGLEIVEASERFLQDFGCTLADVVGRELTEFVAASDRRTLLALDRALSQATTTRIDITVVLEVGKIEHLTRTLIERHGDHWRVSVECIDGRQNLIFDLLADRRRWSTVIEGSSDGLVFLDRARRITDYNARFVELMKFRSEHGVLVGEEALPGREFERLIAGDGFAGLRAHVDAMWSSTGYSAAIELHAGFVEFDVRPLFMPTRGLTGYAITLHDVADRHRADNERQARQREELEHREAIIAAQRSAIRALSAPRIPVTKQLMVVPFVGEIDRARMVEITHELLEGLSRAGTRAVILDITGVPNLDAGAVAGLVSAGRALRKIGIRAMLTGVRPATALLLAHSEFSTHELEVRASLEDAIASLVSKT